MHIARKATSITFFVMRCCSQWQPMPPFEALPAGFLDNIASVSRNSFLCHASFWTSGKTTRSLICPTTFQAREARSLRSPVQSASYIAVDACQAHDSNVSNVCKSSMLDIQFPSNNRPAFVRFFEEMSCTLNGSPCVRLPFDMTICTACTFKESNIAINRGPEEMLQPMATNASFRSIASWLSDNIASVSRNSFLCHASF